MNIKEKIGQRIQDERKAKGLTRKALAELTDDLKQSRINNWERGERTPGPEEIKQLARALEISPAYLMCLSDEKPAKRAPGLSVLVPLLDHKQACDTREVIDAIRNQEDVHSVGFVSVSSLLMPQLSAYAFALRMADDSMISEMRVGDVLVVDPAVAPEPGDFVVVKISGKSEVIVCLYRKLSYTSSEFELLTLNENWPNVSVDESVQVGIIGKVVQNVRGYY